MKLNFQLTEDAHQNGGDTPSRSQIVTTSHGRSRKLPYAFTGHGARMASNVLNSPTLSK